MDAMPESVSPTEYINMDLIVWGATQDKLTLRQTGLLMRSIIAARAAKRPTREQQILLALYTNEGEKAS